VFRLVLYCVFGNLSSSLMQVYGWQVRSHEPSVNDLDIFEILDLLPIPLKHQLDCSEEKPNSHNG
jgi:hypothetical protein